MSETMYGMSDWRYISKETKHLIDNGKVMEYDQFRPVSILYEGDFVMCYLDDRNDRNESCYLYFYCLA